MKNALLCLILAFFGLISSSSAQDLIYKKDGTREETKVILVGEKEIQYRKFNNPDGPVYSIPRSEIMMITYANGEFETFASQPSAAKLAKQDLAENFARNLLGYHLFDVVYGDFTFSYERILSSGTVGLKIPIGFGYAYNSDYFNNSNEWVKNLIYSGLGVNFYPTGQGKWRYFLGPNVRVGYGKQSHWVTIWDENGNYLYDEEQDEEGIYTKFYVDNGIMFTPVRNFSISSIVGVGIRYFPQADYYYNVVMPTGYFSININYRF